MLTAKIRMTFSLAASATYRMTRRHRMFIGDLRCSKPDTPLHPNELVQPGLSTEAILKHRSKWRLIREAIGTDCWRKIAISVRRAKPA
jgi:hypothetical protein